MPRTVSELAGEPGSLAADALVLGIQWSGSWGRTGAVITQPVLLRGSSCSLCDKLTCIFLCFTRSLSQGAKVHGGHVLSTTVSPGSDTVSGT